ncbi:MAG: excinuclease ABC subunit C, partial [Bacteroidales bacterium]|nr:excinuclease ABC subunit C [Bacteroidales bacterium]
LRTCKYALTPENIAKKKFKVCLEYHINRCKAPCTGQQTEDEYLAYISQIKKILKGNIRQVADYLGNLMNEYAGNLEFEKAQKVKEKLEFVKRFQAKSTVVNPAIHNVDVCSIVSDEKNAYLNYLTVMNGSIIQTHTVRIKKKLDESNEELLILGITELRQRFNSQTKEIIVPLLPDFQDEHIEFTVPKIGDRKKLLDLSTRNAKYLKMEYDKRQAATEGKSRQKIILEQLQKDLKLPALPIHIECFDNSNIQGTNAVASCVVFRNGKPAKKDYRKFKIKTVTGANDFASMEEIVFRRYKRLLDEQQPLPQLIVIDGGKGQLNAAIKSLKQLEILHRITIIGIAKKLEEIYLPGHSLPLYLDKKSSSLRLIQKIRDETHRFGISFHRNKRLKQMTLSELDNIKGIGPKTKAILLNHFKTIANIKASNQQELTELIGSGKALLIKENL